MPSGQASLRPKGVLLRIEELLLQYVRCLKDEKVSWHGSQQGVVLQEKFSRVLPQGLDRLPGSGQSRPRQVIEADGRKASCEPLR